MSSSVVGYTILDKKATQIEWVCKYKQISKHVVNKVISNKKKVVFHQWLEIPEGETLVNMYVQAPNPTQNLLRIQCKVLDKIETSGLLMNPFMLRPRMDVPVITAPRAAHCAILLLAAPRAQDSCFTRPWPRPPMMESHVWEKRPSSLVFLCLIEVACLPNDRAVQRSVAGFSHFFHP